MDSPDSTITTIKLVWSAVLLSYATVLLFLVPSIWMLRADGSIEVQTPINSAIFMSLLVGFWGLSLAYLGISGILNAGRLPRDEAE
jgi:hypothetical protein